MRIFAVLLAAIALPGCAGSMIEEGMTKMVGQPLSAAVAKLGLPTEERVIAGQKVYVWYSGRMIEGTTSACRIRAIMQGDVISSWDYEGNEGACLRYAAQLRG
jgi:hypothetical protein